MSVTLRRLLFWGAFAVVLGLGLVVAFRPQPVTVDVASVERGELRVTVDEEGESRVHDVYVLSAPVAGRMRRIDLHAGDPVTALQTVVARIEPIDPTLLDPRSEAQARADVHTAEAAEALARAEVEQAEAELDFAHREFDRARELIQPGTISQRELDDAERTYRTRRAALTSALARHEMRNFELERSRAQLLSPTQTRSGQGDCVCIDLRAPVSGRILRILQQSESVVAAATPLVEVGDPRDLEIVVDLLSADAVKTAPGQSVIIDGWGGEQPLRGRVRVVEPFGFTKTSALGIEEQRVNVVIDLTSPPAEWERLAHGYQVDVHIVLADDHDVLKVPLTALFRDGPDWAVFVERDGRARLEHVTLGNRSGSEAAIVTGLDAGDRVVLHPSDRVLEGVRLVARGA